MNIIELIGITFMEELGEVQQATSKCLRFTPGHQYCEYNATNLGLLSTEWGDANMMVGILEALDVPIVVPERHMSKKLLRVLRRVADSEVLGVIPEGESDKLLKALAESPLPALRGSLIDYQTVYADYVAMAYEEHADYLKGTGLNEQSKDSTN